MNAICPDVSDDYVISIVSAEKISRTNSKQQAMCSLFAYPLLVLLLNLEDGSSGSLQNVLEYLADYTASYPQKGLFTIAVERTSNRK
jgi:hypothetical protein